jgi:hypothetical protein
LDLLARQALVLIWWRRRATFGENALADSRVTFR